MQIRLYSSRAERIRYQSMLDREHQSTHKALDIAHQGYQAEVNREHQTAQAEKTPEVVEKKPKKGKE